MRHADVAARFVEIKELSIKLSQRDVDIAEKVDVEIAFFQQVLILAKDVHGLVLFSDRARQIAEIFVGDAERIGNSDGIFRAEDAVMKRQAARLLGQRQGFFAPGQFPRSAGAQHENLPEAGFIFLTRGVALDFLFQQRLRALQVSFRFGNLAALHLIQRELLEAFRKFAR